jgi:site-specific DNA-methyltransferase (cytosine-N4-specific)
MKNGGEARQASYGDGAYRLRPGSFKTETDGRIPRNLIMRGHACSDTAQYRADATRLNLPIHGAMQPIAIAEFLIRFLTRESDFVVDPFGGTATTAMAAERLGRRWLVVERMLEYLRGGGERFQRCDGFRWGHGVA